VGAAFSRDLPGQSRLKTAPTIQEQQIQNYKVSFSIRLVNFQASGGARVKLHLTNAASGPEGPLGPTPRREVGMWNAEGWRRCALSF